MRYGSQFRKCLQFCVGTNRWVVLLTFKLFNNAVSQASYITSNAVGDVTVVAYFKMLCRP
jgi:hypothetical protein